MKKEEAEKRKALESVSKECEKLKQAQQKLKCTEVELNAKIEMLDKQIKDSERKTNHWRKEIEQLRRLEKQEEIDYDFSDDEDEEEDEDEKMQDEAKESDVEEDDAMDESKDQVVEDGGEEKPKVEEAAEAKMAMGSSSLPELADASLEQYSTDSIKNDISVLEKERDTLSKNANMGAIAEYRKKEADYLSR